MSKYLLDIVRARFTNRWIVFVIDMVISGIVSYFTLMVAAIITNTQFPLMLSQDISVFLILAILFNGIGAFIMQTHAGTIRHTTMTDALRVLAALMLKTTVYVVMPTILINRLSPELTLLCTVFDILLTFVMQLVFRIMVVVTYRYMVYNSDVKQSDRERMFVYISSNNPITSLNSIYEKLNAYSLVGYLMYGQKMHRRIADHPVFFFNDIKTLKNLIIMRKIDCVLFTCNSDLTIEKDRLVRYCEKYKIKTLMMPSADIIENGRAKSKHYPKVKIEDLLGRDEIKINMERIAGELNGKVILVSGAAGSIGSEICRQLCCFSIKKLVLFDNAETPMHNIKLELAEKFPTVAVEVVVGCVRQLNKIESVLAQTRPYAIFHAAAYKHVPLMEDNPSEAMLTNVVGTRNMADSAVKFGVERFVMVSTDKAVNPTNVMGASKRAAEIYVQSLGRAISRGLHPGYTKFITTRFGNVLGSNGSVIPLFRRQIEEGGPLTITHPEIIRYFMTIPEACGLVLEAGAMGEGNEIFVFDMGKPVKIVDLAKRMIEMAGMTLGRDIDIAYTGLRPGEKLYEELLAHSEGLLQTFNPKIFRAKVREYELCDIVSSIYSLERLAKMGATVPIVQELKKFIPEYISNNSQFEVLDASLPVESAAEVTPEPAVEIPQMIKAPKPTIEADGVRFVLSKQRICS